MLLFGSESGEAVFPAAFSAGAFAGASSFLPTGGGEKGFSAAPAPGVMGVPLPVGGETTGGMGRVLVTLGAGEAFASRAFPSSFPSATPAPGLIVPAVGGTMGGTGVRGLVAPEGGVDWGCPPAGPAEVVDVLPVPGVPVVGGMGPR